MTRLIWLYRGMNDLGAQAPERVAVRELNGIMRVVVASAGLAGLSLGVLATFKTDNQAGTAALLAVGSVASLLALVGKLPLRWVIGGSEFDMSDAVARETVDAVASQLDPDQTADLADRLAMVDRSNLSPMTSMMRDVVDFEQDAIQRVTDVVAKHANWDYAPVTSVADRGVDGYLIVSGRSIPVEYKWVRDAASIGSTLQMLQRHQGANYQDLIVILSGRPVTSLKFQRRLQTFRDPRIHAVFLDDPDFEVDLEMAVLTASGPTDKD